MLGSVTGMHKSATRGSSVEFAEYRKYVPGDDIRHIDWQAYARSDRFYIKEYEADTNLRAYLVVDASGSMDFTSSNGHRMHYARVLAAHLAYLLIQQGDAVGLHCCSEEVSEDIPARQTPSHLQNIFRALNSCEPLGVSNLVDALHRLAERVQRRALFIVISDLLMPSDGVLDALQHLRFCRHDVSLFHLVDPEELQFDFSRPTRFVDLEGQGDLVADPTVVRQVYLDAVERHLTLLLRGCREHHMDYRRVMIDRDVEQILSAFLLERAGQKKTKGRR